MQLTISPTYEQKLYLISICYMYFKIRQPTIYFYNYFPVNSTAHLQFLLASCCMPSSLMFP